MAISLNSKSNIQQKTIVKDIYFGTFTLFARLGEGQWPKRMNAEVHGGVAGLSFILLLWPLGLGLLWDGFGFGIKILGKPTLIIMSLSAYAVNYAIINKRYNNNFDYVAQEHRSNKTPSDVIAPIFIVISICFVVAAGMYYRSNILGSEPHR